MAAIGNVVPLQIVETVTINGMATGPRMPLTFGSSPCLFQNTTPTRMLMFISGGTVSLIEFSRDGDTFDSVGLLGGDFLLGVGDWLRVTYTLAPSGVYYPI